MTEEKKTLEVGDVVYGYSYGNVSSRYKITRVTKTKAVCKRSNGSERCFDRKIGSGGWITEKPRPDSWSLTSYYLATPERKQKFEEAKLRNKLTKTEWKEVPVEKLKRIVEILEED